MIDILAGSGPTHPSGPAGPRPPEPPRPTQPPSKATGPTSPDPVGPPPPPPGPPRPAATQPTPFPDPVQPHPDPNIPPKRHLPTSPIGRGGAIVAGSIVRCRSRDGLWWVRSIGERSYDTALLARIEEPHDLIEVPTEMLAGAS